MKNKKNTIMLVVIVISIVILTWNKSYSYEMNDNIVEEKEIERKEFGIYYQIENEQYEEKNEFPKQGYLLNERLTKCHEYGNKEEIKDAVEQSLTKGVIDGSIIVTSNKSMYCKIYFDKDDIKPIINILTLTGTPDTETELTDNTKYTHTTNITYDVSWSDEDVAQICVKEGSTTCTEAEWKEISGTKSKSGNIEISSTEGEKTIKAYLKDKANNISEVKTGEITLDTTNPSITLTEDASKTTENSITVTVEATDTNGIKSVTCSANGNGETKTGAYDEANKTCTFNDLKAGIEYTITGEATDKSGRKNTNTINIPTVKEITYTCDGIGGTLSGTKCEMNAGYSYKECNCVTIRCGSTQTSPSRLYNSDSECSSAAAQDPCATDEGRGYWCVTDGWTGKHEYWRYEDKTECEECLIYSCDSGWTLSGTKCYKDAKQN